MISWLKKHFIPHEGNSHRPHILRRQNTRNIILVLLLLETLIFLLPTISHLNTTGGMAAVLPAVLDDLTNAKRESQNLAILTVNPVLNKAAEMKAVDMATKGYFAHTSPEGKTPWYWLEAVGYQYQYAGENLAIDFIDSQDVTNAWMNSPTHKANIVKKNYTEIGTGIATGIYEGHSTVFVVQVYANPLPKTTTPAKQITETKTAKVSTPAEVKNVLPKVLGAEAVPNNTLPVTEPTFWQKIFASPRNTTNTILLIFFGIIFVALLLYIIIKMKNHHADLITNGLVVLAIIGAIFIANYYLSYREMVTIQSLDYSNQKE
jgi:hypothetical protein